MQLYKFQLGGDTQGKEIFREVLPSGANFVAERRHHLHEVTFVVPGKAFFELPT